MGDDCYCKHASFPTFSVAQKSSQRLTDSQAAQKAANVHTHILDIKSDYRVIFAFSADMQPTTIIVEPHIKTLRSYKLACQTSEVSFNQSLQPLENVLEFYTAVYMCYIYTSMCGWVLAED